MTGVEAFKTNPNISLEDFMTLTLENIPGHKKQNHLLRSQKNFEERKLAEEKALAHIKLVY